jgi:hypothetical protein
MQALALETPHKRECFRRELQSTIFAFLQKQNNSLFCLELNGTNGTSFWTSGSSDKCPNSYGWCGTGEKELIDYQLLDLDPFQSAGGKECVSATLDKSDLILRPDSCFKKMRFICEVKPQLGVKQTL